jgi:protein-disulfide isomerase
MHDLLFADQGRLEDPHLWARARELGLHLERFDADRRSDAATTRIRADFLAGVRAGVASTPALVVDGRLLPSRPDDLGLRQLVAGTGDASSSGTRAVR